MYVGYELLHVFMQASVHNCTANIICFATNMDTASEDPFREREREREYMSLLVTIRLSNMQPV